MRRRWMGFVAAALAAGCGGATVDGATALRVLEVAPTALDFGQVQSDSHTRLEVTVHNPDGRPWAVEVSLEVAEDFSTRLGTFDVDPGETLVIPVSLDAAWEPSVHADTLVLSLRDSGDRLEIPLTGETVRPQVAVDPLTLSFGDVPVGRHKRLTVTVSNRGVGEVRLGETKTYDAESYMPSTAFWVEYPEQPEWAGALAVEAGRAVTLEAVFEPKAVGAWGAEHRLDVRPFYPDAPRIHFTGRGVE